MAYIQNLRAGILLLLVQEAHGMILYGTCVKALDVAKGCLLSSFCDAALVCQNRALAVLCSTTALSLLMPGHF